MALEGRLTSLFEDKEHGHPLFPRTKTKAITDDNNIRLDIKLANIETTLESKASQDYVKSEIAKAQFGDTDGSTIDLSGYATKDDLNAKLSKILTSDDYGDTLPAPGNKGRIFFKKVIV